MEFPVTKIKEVLNQVDAKLNKSDAIDGIMVGMLMNQNWDKLHQAIEYTKSMGNILQDLPNDVKISKYSEYFNDLYVKIHGVKPVTEPQKKREIKEECKAKKDPFNSEESEMEDLIVAPNPNTSTLACWLCNKDFDIKSNPQACGHSYHPKCMKTHLLRKLHQGICTEKCFSKD
jgi:hypothetical protein